MKPEDFAYDLPQELIAQYPLEQRDTSRLLVFLKDSGEMKHRQFSDITELLHAGDMLVLNDTKVMPAKLFGKKETGGRVEVLLIKRIGKIGNEEHWQALISPSKGVVDGKTISFNRRLNARIAGGANGYRNIIFSVDGDLRKALTAAGTMPLPPYIKRETIDSDAERYQTVFARREGAIAAPTAGLHFTHKLLNTLRAKGVDIKFITLHTGPGTFMPVKADNIEDHRMLPEHYEIDRDTFAAIRKTKERNGKVIAVGSTTTRALEAAAASGNKEPCLRGATDLFIYPGYTFRVIDGLITNFHLPKSTLIMLVAGLIGTENTIDVYREAVRRRYRFYSYGDAMVII